MVDSCDDGFEVSVQNMVFDVSEVSDNEADVPSPWGGSQGTCHQHRELFVFPNGTEFLLPPGISLESLSANEAALAAEVIKRHEPAFSKDPYDLGCTALIPHEINLHDSKPVNQ